MALPVRVSPRAGLQRYAEFIRGEYAGGILLLVGMALALLWANSPWAGTYQEVQEFVVGPGIEALHLDLSLRHWATDGLLAIFFFVVGVELKREFTTGALSTLREAITPVIAAVAGMAVPAGIFLAINLAAPNGDPHAWAIPVATDIAVALALLGLLAPGIPAPVRAFLLALAVTDDLLGILVIAVFYAEALHLIWLLASAALVVIFALLLRRGVLSPWILLPIAVLAWWTMHLSGVHATIAGVALGLVVPAVGSSHDAPALTEHFEHRWSPISVGFVIPVFAFFATGIPVNVEAIEAAFTSPIGLGVVLGLVVGKPLGIVLSTLVAQRLLRTPLEERFSTGALMVVGAFAGIGLTVSVLIAELALRQNEVTREVAVLAILLASTIAAAIGGVLARLMLPRHSRKQDARIDAEDVGLDS